MLLEVDYCIIGAGPSGLTAAYVLSKASKKVLLIERDARIGGLAKSHSYGDHIFDTGPKRFHTDDPKVLNFINEVTKNQIAHIGRSTEVYFLKKYFSWPLTINDVIKLPPSMALKCLYDLITKTAAIDKDSFHQYIKAKYGESLYQVFFKPYTQKFLRWDSEDIHSDWASTGINRSVVDSRINAQHLGALFKLVLLPKKIETEFLYPLQGGFGGFYEQLLDLCRMQSTFNLLLNSSVTTLRKNKDRLELTLQDGTRVICKDLIWTGNLNNLLGLMGQVGQLKYLNTIFYNLICHEHLMGKRRAQWIYVSQGDSLISRITCMKEFSSYTCPHGYYNLIAELTDNQLNPKYFRQPKKYERGIIDELVAMRFIQSAQAVERVHINSVVDTYPIYHKKYMLDFSRSKAAVMKYSKHVHLLGRCGAFWYNNSDHSIRFALEMANRLLSSDPEPFDYRHYFGGLTHLRQ